MPRTLVQSINARRPATCQRWARHMPAEMMQSECDRIRNLQRQGVDVVLCCLCRSCRTAEIGTNRRHNRRPTNPIWQLPTLEVVRARRSQLTLEKGMPLITLTPGELITRQRSVSEYGLTERKH